MVQFIDACVAPGNVMLTVLLWVCLLYWLMVVLGALKPATLDIDIEVEEDDEQAEPVEEPAERDGGDAEEQESNDVEKPAVKLVPRVLDFLNVGRVPLMILLTVWLFCAWLVAVLLYAYTGGWLAVFQVVLLAPYLCIGAVLARFITMPLRVLRDKARSRQRADRSVIRRDEGAEEGD